MNTWIYPVEDGWAMIDTGYENSYASVVKKFFVAKSDLALRKVYMLIQEQKELVQKHDALEDARMLETVVAHLYDKCKPEDKETILAMPSQPRPQTGKKAPTIFQKWNSQPKWEAETGANENGWVLKCTDQHSGQQNRYRNENPPHILHHAKGDTVILQIMQFKNLGQYVHCFAVSQIRVGEMFTILIYGNQ